MVCELQSYYDTLFVGHAVLAHAGESSARARERLPSAVSCGFAYVLCDSALKGGGIQHKSSVRPRDSS